MNRGELIGIVEKRAEVASEGLDGGWSSLQSVKLVRTEGRVGLQRQHEDRGKSTLPIADSRHRKWSFASELLCFILPCRWCLLLLLLMMMF